MLTVLVEGKSDKVALETLARKVGVSPHWQVVSLGGVTNIRRALDNHTDVAGLCDSGEERFFLKALGVPDRAAMEPLGFFVCERDLEEEFIRALGVEGVERVVEELGQLQTLRTFKNQPFQRSRTAEQQLRRFMGTMSGRKSLYAEALVNALDVIPKPLEKLLEYSLRS
ncbi:ATP-dependent endonuclease [Glaciihabitans arcticus]|uniref:ATP-dependent endonuclease n=1 Tax=Glaciihabitans arcticus TaxID=2668039 RepID=A0A4Q9GTP0_9MICO|nr:ATP-dependent endonuclease [Glaciihabitans arcticus]TBN57544.1 ATP-dependent endonuclease [Glaciihabitans arcticus]